MSQQLHTAIKDVFTNFGVELVKTSKLVNYLSDYGAFNDIHDAQKVFKMLLDQGYGEKIYELYVGKKAWKDEFAKIKKEFCKAEGYKEDLVDYILQSIAFGLGWIKTISSPLIAPQQAFDPVLINYDFNKQLASLKSEYITMVYDLIKVPSGGLYSKSGYYTANSMAKLALVEGKIAIAQAAIGDKDTDWCSRTKNDALAKYKVSQKKVMTQIGLKIGIPLLAILIGLGLSMSYLTSLDAIRKYEDQMALAKELQDNQDNLKAFETYKSAALYDGSYKPSSYVNEAVEKMTETADKLVIADIAAADDLLKQGDYQGALAIVKAETPYRIKASTGSIKQLSSKVGEIENKLESFVNTGKDKLINSISANGGKLNADSKKLLEQLLKADPENYWLNFILKKSNEKTGK